ncbi:hypothetical protein CRE_23081 [Caenorhabditis remanei]|uniref:Sdz-33 F-box domain-containing protein n=1 Tax=Caenorhabditis remanei TaxID=31234 RepID=E3N9E5_CAERE|nr:hypothetical protein CRE_23081 [Caenorhabditis remanei]
MCLTELWQFSLISTKTKNLVKSLRLKACEVDIRIHGSKDIVVYTRTSHLNMAIRSLTLVNFNKRLNHIRTIFCYSPPPNVCFYGCKQNEIELLKDIIGNANVLYVYRGLTDVLSREVLKQFDTPNRLDLDRNPFKDTCQIQELFIQNFETIVFYDVYSLDDMLLVNSEEVRFCCSTTQKQFNQFLKHWIRGSNPRLQRMNLSINKTDVASGEVYLKGIRCIEISEDAKREIRQKQEHLSGGMVQIRRKDGTPVVISTYDAPYRHHIRLIVLH